MGWLTHSDWMTAMRCYNSGMSSKGVGAGILAWLLRFALPMTMLAGCASDMGRTTVSCSRAAPSQHPIVVPVWLDDAWTQREREELRAAVDEWNEALSPQMRLDVISGPVPKPGLSHAPGIGIDRISSEDLPEEVRDGVLGFVPRLGSGDITLVADAVADAHLHLRRVALHELGHALGAPHTTNGLSLMAVAYQSGVGCIDGWTLDQVAPFNGLRRELMHATC